MLGKRVRSEGDSVGDLASGTAQGILGDLGGRGYRLIRTTVWLLIAQCGRCRHSRIFSGSLMSR